MRVNLRTATTSLPRLPQARGAGVQIGKPVERPGSGIQQQPDSNGGSGGAGVAGDSMDAVVRQRSDMTLARDLSPREKAVRTMLKAADSVMRTVFRSELSSPRLDTLQQKLNQYRSDYQSLIGDVRKRCGAKMGVGMAAVGVVGTAIATLTSQKAKTIALQMLRTATSAANKTITALNSGDVVNQALSIAGTALGISSISLSLTSMAFSAKKAWDAVGRVRQLGTAFKSFEPGTARHDKLKQLDGGEQLAALLKDIALRGKDAQKVRAGRLAVQTGMDFLSAGAVVGSIACGLGSLPGLAFSCSVAAAKRTMNSVVPKVYAAEQKEITKDVITLSKLTLDVQEKLAAGKPLDGKDEEVVRFVIRDLNLGDKASARLTTPVTQAELDKFMTITYDNIMQQLRY